MSRVAGLLALFGVFLAGPARALPVSLSVDAGASHVTASILEPFPSDPQAISLTGTLLLDLSLVDDAFFGLLPTAARPDGGALALSDATYLLDTPPGLSITIDGSGVAGSLAGTTIPGFPFGVGEALFEFGGSVLSLDAGMLMGTGEELGNPLSFEADLALTPLGFVLPLNSVARIRVTPVGSEDFDVTLTLPFQVSAAVVADPGVATTLGLEGELVLTGRAIVPEPGTGALLLAGLLALATRRPSSRRAACLACSAR